MVEQVWLITGASSGLGKAMVESALADGHKVVAAVRNTATLEDLRAKYQLDQLMVVQLDVTKPREIDSAFGQALAHFGRVDVVFNNAGIAIVAEVEGTTDKIARDMFEVMFWGAANVSRAAMECFRNNSPIGGRLFQVSSDFALDGAPGAGYYSASKAALEALSESLSKELDPVWNIKITIIEPGPFQTRIATSHTTIFPSPPAYANPELATNFLRKMLGTAAFDGDPEKAVKLFLKLAVLDEPPFRFPIHKMAVDFARTKARHLNDAADKWESWSEDLYIQVETSPE